MFSPSVSWSLDDDDADDDESHDDGDGDGDGVKVTVCGEVCRICGRLVTFFVVCVLFGIAVMCSYPI